VKMLAAIGERLESASRPKTVVESYFALRLVLGILGIALPFMLVTVNSYLCKCVGLQDSISDYYSLRTRDVLVGTLFAIAWFLITYRYATLDKWAGFLAGAFALLVALFPNSGGDLERKVHFVSAAGLFLVFSFFSLYLFRKSGPGRPMTRQKRLRNRVYLGCGLLILTCIVLTAVFLLFLQDTAAVNIRPVFWLESVALWSFGAAWLVKGEAQRMGLLPGRVSRLLYADHLQESHPGAQSPSQRAAS